MNSPDFLLTGGEERASVHSLIPLGPYSLDQLVRNKFSLDILLKGAGFHSAVHEAEYKEACKSACTKV